MKWAGEPDLLSPINKKVAKKWQPFIFIQNSISSTILENIYKTSTLFLFYA